MQKSPTKIQSLKLPVGIFKPGKSIPPPAASQVLAGCTVRPLWFDGRFLAATDVEREQIYFLRRQAELGRAGGFGVIHGLFVDQGAPTGQPPTAETIVIRSGVGITPAGRLVMISTDLTIQLTDLPEEEDLDIQFGLAATPRQPARTRTGIYVVALRPVQFTANPISTYPANLQDPRITHDGDVVEATAVSLVPYPNPVNNYDVALQQAALAREIFVTADTGPLSDAALSDAVLPIAMISLDRDVIQWVDPYLVRRDSGPQYSGTRFGLADPAVQQAFLMQYDARLQAIVAARPTGNFAATDFFQALPPGGRFPLDAIDPKSMAQAFFPQQMDVRLSAIPADELPALLAESMSLPPIDLTLPAASYANLAVYALFPTPRDNYDAVKSALPDTALTPTLHQFPLLRRPLLPAGRPATARIGPPLPPATFTWATALRSQKFGFYVLRRSKPVFPDFESVTPAPRTTPAPTTTRPS